MICVLCLMEESLRCVRCHIYIHSLSLWTSSLVSLKIRTFWNPFSNRKCSSHNFLVNILATVRRRRKLSFVSQQFFSSQFCKKTNMQHTIYKSKRGENKINTKKKGTSLRTWCSWSTNQSTFTKVTISHIVLSKVMDNQSRWLNSHTISSSVFLPVLFLTAGNRSSVLDNVDNIDQKTRCRAAVPQPMFRSSFFYLLPTESLEIGIFLI